MRSAFAHTAELDLTGDADAPSAAITAELGGSAVHHTATACAGGRVRVRVLFACDVDLEDEVRLRIDRALAAGLATGSDGAVTRWAVRDAMPGMVRECERLEAEQLMCV
jgi:hypothetical protein